MNDVLITNTLIYQKESNKYEKKDILVVDGVIVEIKNQIQGTMEKTIDACGHLVLPGMVDIHNDEFEHLIAPKRGCLILNKYIFDNIMVGFYQNGITKACLAVTYSIEPGIRNQENTHKILSQLKAYKSNFRFPRSTGVNLRVELTSNWEMLIPLIKEFLNEIDTITLCDHSPNNSQGWTENQFYRYLSSRAKIGEEAYKTLISNMDMNKQRNSPCLTSLVNEIRNMGIPVGLHDMADGSEYFDGIRYGEFPNNMEVINYLKEKDLFVVMGAPNLRRGKSLNGNVSSMSVCNEEKCDVICTDYSKVTMLDSITRFGKAAETNYVKAYHMVSDNPAKLLNLKKGKIEVGYDADLIFINEEGTKVYKTIVGGSVSYESFI